jgi:hypothetical protein
MQYGHIRLCWALLWVVVLQSLNYICVSRGHLLRGRVFSLLPRNCLFTCDVAVHPVCLSLFTRCGSVLRSN